MNTNNILWNSSSSDMYRSILCQIKTHPPLMAETSLASIHAMPCTGLSIDNACIGSSSPGFSHLRSLGTLWCTDSAVCSRPGGSDAHLSSASLLLLGVNPQGAGLGVESPVGGLYFTHVLSYVPAHLGCYDTTMEIFGHWMGDIAPFLWIPQDHNWSPFSKPHKSGFH